ncbi:MAG: SDR family oxidoreductase [Myxococcales bacterium]|nr:MAG: SDR family oxidoreductase [Myxococcales bacterium]
MTTAPVMLVTGATDGIGKQTARALAERGVEVVVHGRDPRKAERTAAEIRNAVGRPIGFIVGDLSSLESVRALADEVVVRHPRLSVLVNNAGVFCKQKQTSADGFELTFAVNHLAHFLLTERLLPTLTRNAPARVVTVSSNVHLRTRLPRVGPDLDEAELRSPRSFDGYTAYARSKQANVLFAVGLAGRLDPARVTSNALHPGVIATKLLREGFGMTGGGSLGEGAVTSVYAATSDELTTTTGKYLARAALAPASIEEGDVEPLRELSERWCARWL